MKAVLDDMNKLYTEYYTSMEQLTKKRASLQGVFRSMMANGPGANACNEQFYQGVKTCVDNYAKTQPESGDVFQVIQYVLEHNSSKPVGTSTGLMLDAVHGCLLPLVPLLSPKQAQELLAEYYGRTKRNRLLPIQKELMFSLKSIAKK